MSGTLVRNDRGRAEQGQWAALDARGVNRPSAAGAARGARSGGVRPAEAFRGRGRGRRSVEGEGESIESLAAGLRRACEVSYAVNEALDERCARLVAATGSHPSVRDGAGESAAALLAYLDLARWGADDQTKDGAGPRRSSRFPGVSGASGAPGTLADRAEEALHELVRALAVAAPGASASGGAIVRSARLRAMVDAARVEASSARDAERDRAPTTMTIGAGPVRSAA